MTSLHSTKLAGLAGHRFFWMGAVRTVLAKLASRRSDGLAVLGAMYSCTIEQLDWTPQLLLLHSKST